MVSISVVLPIYNVEDYLEECLDSIVNQTFTDLEIICVNDGSKDNSLEILKEYAKKMIGLLLLLRKMVGMLLQPMLEWIMQQENIYF